MGRHKKEKKKKHKSETADRGDEEDTCEHPSLEQVKKGAQPSHESPPAEKEGSDGPKSKKSKKHKKEKKSKKDKNKKEKKKRKRETESSESGAENEGSGQKEGSLNRKDSSENVSPKLPKLVDYDVAEHNGIDAKSNGVKYDPEQAILESESTPSNGSQGSMQEKEWVAPAAVVDFEEDDEMTEHPMICNLVPRPNVLSNVSSLKVTSLKGQIVSSSMVAANEKISSNAKNVSVMIHGWIMWPFGLYFVRGKL